MKRMVLLSLVVLLAATASAQTTTGSINGHEWVDLGLSVKWATCNVGASSPEGYGNYYAWGETRTKTTYTEDNCATGRKTMRSIAGNATYDAARANWGGTWRLPTSVEIQELVDKCQWTWTTQGGYKGYKITGPNGNSIFLPAAGERDEALSDAGRYGNYWSATPEEGYSTYAAYELYFQRYDIDMGWVDRFVGRSVRAVTE